jgi:hypothetical protein
MHSAFSSQVDEKTPSCPQTHKERNNRRSIIVEMSLQNILVRVLSSLAYQRREYPDSPLKNILLKRPLKTSSQNVLPKHPLKTSSQNVLPKRSLKTSSQNVLSKTSFQKHPLKTSSQNILSKHPLKTSSQNVLSKIFSQNILSKRSLQVSRAT